jgi:hypothetical protein
VRALMVPRCPVRTLMLPRWPVPPWRSARRGGVLPDAHAWRLPIALTRFARIIAARAPRARAADARVVSAAIIATSATSVRHEGRACAFRRTRGPARGPRLRASSQRALRQIYPSIRINGQNHPNRFAAGAGPLIRRTEAAVPLAHLREKPDPREGIRLHSSMSIEEGNCSCGCD